MISSTLLLSFLLVLTRIGAWILTAPLLGAAGVSKIGKLAVVLSLSLFCATTVHPVIAPDLPGLVMAVLAEVAVGLTLGWLTGLLLLAAEAAGALADFMSGFSYAQVLDPMSGQASSGFARLSSMTFFAILLVSNGYELIIQGLLSSFGAMPPGAGAHLSSHTPQLLGMMLTSVVMAAIELGAPLLGTLFLTDVVLGLIARFVPQTNAISVGLPLKALIALSAAGTLFLTMPQHLDGLLHSALRLPGEVLR